VYQSVNCLQDASRPLNLVQERNIITVGSTDMPYPNLPREFKKVNCNPESVVMLSVVVSVYILSKNTVAAQHLAFPSSTCMRIITIRYDTRCYSNMCSKGDVSQLNLPYRTKV